MDWSKIQGLSQAHMEEWLRAMTSPDAAVLARGVIPKMRPRFVSCDFEEGALDFAYPVLEWELNPRKTLHGGITSTALDSTVGALCHYYTYPQVLTTVTMDITFLKPILPGDTFHIRAKMVSLGRTLATATGEVVLERGNTLAAVCTATYKVLHRTVRQLKEEESVSIRKEEKQ